MSPPVPLLALALALCGLILLVALIWHRRWLELALVVLVGCALALHLERGRRTPDTIGKLAAEVVNKDRSLSLHVQVEPGSTVYCTSDYTASIPPSGTLTDPALWFVDLRPKYISGSFPLVADADGKVIVTLPAGLLDVGPVRTQFNGKDEGTTRLDPATPSVAEGAETLDVPFYYEWANPGTPEEMKRALEPVQRKIDGLDRLVSYECKVNPSGRADYTVSFLMKDDSMTDAREIYRSLYEALDEVPVPDGAVLRVPVLVKGVKTPGQPPATDALPAQP